MMWRNMARLGGAALAVASLSSLAARPASAQIERVLAGIRLNSKSTTVLARYGNPNQVVIGDVGLRGGNATQGAPGEGAPLGDGPGLPSLPGAPSFPGGAPGVPPPSGGLGAGSPAGRVGGGKPLRGGAGAGPFADPLDYLSGPLFQPPTNNPGFGAPTDQPPGFGQNPGFGQGGNPYGQGSGQSTVGPFGQTTSTLARQQEVTWIYNRKVNNNLVSYEFLIGPNGQVSQISVSGYMGGNSRTAHGIALGSTYKDVVRAYGFPEEHSGYSRVLIASYRQKSHALFQFLNQSGEANPLNGGNKVIKVTIATVE